MKWISRELASVPMTILLLVFCACAPNPTNQPQDNEWPAAMPASPGLDGRVFVSRL